MAILTPAFHTESEKVHNERNVLAEELRLLDQALDKLEGDADLSASLATAKQIQIFGKRLAEELPEEFRHEERAVFATVAEVSPELESFSREMSRQHSELRNRLDRFIETLGQLETAVNLDQALTAVREEGKALTRELGRHMAMEDIELSGFL